VNPLLRDALLAALDANVARLRADVLALIALPPVPEAPKEVLGPETQAAIRTIVSDAGGDREVRRIITDRAVKLATTDGWPDDAIAADLLSGYQEI